MQHLDNLLLAIKGVVLPSKSVTVCIGNLLQTKFS